MTELKLEVGKTYIDNGNHEVECVCERGGWYYCCYKELHSPKHRRAFSPDGKCSGDAAWHLVKEKTENKVWLNVYKNKGDEYVVFPFLSKKVANSAAAGHRLKLLCLDLDNVTVEEV